jgi:glycosyltransferase involved in cell wall biosynthesis
MSSLEPSGMEMMFLSSASAWGRQGIECDILSMAASLGSMAPRLKAVGYGIFHIPFRSKYRFLPNIGFLLHFYRLCRDRKYHAIHIHTETAPPVYALLAKAAGVPTVALSVHSTFHFRGVLRSRKALERRIVRLLGGRYGMISDSVAKCESEEFRNAGVRILNWIDVEHFRPPTREERAVARNALGISPSARVLLSVGNCAEVKNHGELLRAVHVLQATTELLYLHVGAERNDLPERDLARQLGINGIVRFCGSQQNIRTYLWSCDLFVMPSLYEGLGIAALEAIASGCSVLLSRVPALVDLEELAHHLHYAEPNAASLAAEIGRLLAEPDEIENAEFQEDSATIRSHFAPSKGVGIIAERLYGFPHEPTISL